jgi:hypothetical protein
MSLIRSTHWSGLREEGICLTSSWLWCFGCCQQNLNHLNWVQLTHYKYTFFSPLKKKRERTLRFTEVNSRIKHLWVSVHRIGFSPFTLSLNFYLCLPVKWPFPEDGRAELKSSRRGRGPQSF